jgi:hypothetical protein
MKKAMLAALMTALATGFVHAKTKPQESKEFVIYTERGSRENHYIPSGWMGDYGDLKMNQGWDKNPGEGKHCIKFDYSAMRNQGAGWVGVYWQYPANNWGDKKGGMNLEGFKTLKFKARGEKGGEVIDKFMIGGITGQTEEGDSDEASTDMIELTKDWKEYTIDLTGRNFSYVIGGFGWAMNADSNMNGAVFYVDEIRLVRDAVKTAKK